MTDTEWEAHFNRVEAIGENADPQVKPYPNEALTAVCITLLEDFDLTPTQIANLAMDIPQECEAIEQDRNERAWEQMQERSTDDSKYRQDMRDAGRGHLLGDKR